jgi:hypothetical protein
MCIQDQIKDQQLFAREVLRDLETLDPHCILAGGAPRDWYLEKAANDLDFYMCLPDNWNQMQCKRAIEKVTNLDFHILGGIESEMYESLNELRYVFECSEEYIPVQVMVMKYPTFNCVVDSFCYDTSRAWWKGGIVCGTDNFFLAHEFKVFNVEKPKLDMTGSHYEAKMYARFPEYQPTMLHIRNTYLTYSEKYDIAEECYSRHVKKFYEETLWNK